MTFKRFLASLMLAPLFFSVGATQALAADKAVAAKNAGADNKNRTICIFDFLGKKGPIYTIGSELKAIAELDGFKFDLEAYTNERIATEDFITGKCAGLFASGLRTRQFNPFAGSIEAIGSVTDYEVMRRVLTELQKPGYAKYLENERYAIAGIVPVGKAFFYVNDRSINSLGRAAGKRVASLTHDRAQEKLISMAGATPVDTDITRFMTQFNNNAVDVVVAPAYAYKRLELYRGLGDKGAIIDFPLSVITFQTVLNKSRFTDKEIARIRALVNTKAGMTTFAAENEEREIPSSAWMKLDEKAAAGYVVAMRDARIALRNEGVYDKNMLRLLRLVRCDINPADAECSLKEE